MFGSRLGGDIGAATAKALSLSQFAKYRGPGVVSRSRPFPRPQEQYTLLRCPACSFVWLTHPPKPSEMHLHYTDAYDRLISALAEKAPSAGDS